MQIMEFSRQFLQPRSAINPISADSDTFFVHIQDFLLSESTMPNIAWEFGKCFGLNPRICQTISKSVQSLGPPDDSERFWSKLFCHLWAQNFAIRERFPQTLLRIRAVSSAGHGFPRSLAIRARCSMHLSIRTDFMDAMRSSQLASKQLRERTQDRHTRKTQQQLPTGNGNEQIINLNKIILSDRSAMHCQINCPKYFLSVGIFCAGTVSPNQEQDLLPS